MNNVVWKKINGYEAYEISNTGLVRRGDKILNPSNNSKGYLRIGLQEIKMGACSFIRKNHSKILTCGIFLFPILFVSL